MIDAVQRNELPVQHDRFGFREFLDTSTERGYLYDVPLSEGIVGARIRRGKREFVNFASISFMGFQEDPLILDHFCRAATTYGIVTGGSRATQGVGEPHAMLEACLSRITAREYTITFASGLLANIGFLNAMTTQFSFDEACSIDNQDAVIVMDRNCHWSLWKGASHLKFGRTLLVFRHNDPDHLETVLSRVRSSKKVVVFESIYSSDGGIAPIGALLDVCERHHALSYVDDANGFMIYGRPERPYYTHYQELRRATFLMVSLSKAVGLEGGAISGPREYVQGFEALSGTSLFTAAIQPPTAATAAYLLDRLDQEPSLMNRYLARAANFRRRLLDKGFRLYDTESFIQSVFIGPDQTAEDVRRFLAAEGFAVPVFRYPAVRHGQAVIRLILNSRHTDDDIDRFIDTLLIARQRYEF
ncbi:aminotransferase class I/II-fold pyridoxal phosphate-dependent enzyme [Eleftheria terrae]|uniref:aminotransferase class I/II-fold pyridoxal phosphate-dependent enzyme n=1 Tax=Eleftheria terrae TaxID=1597781 RepID=UPI00263AFAC9|nr:aminotransferase class I/II-fold pyridoxal phosphate-dependent enzyme [Eleftheria terrae]WKB55291.1 aminotransferase class I/II-fold pyridoxal phosphate-dependent enzyme [Eleftheria terrae]